MLQRYFKPKIKTNEFSLFSNNENNIINYELHELNEGIRQLIDSNFTNGILFLAPRSRFFFTCNYRELFINYMIHS